MLNTTTIFMQSINHAQTEHHRLKKHTFKQQTTVHLLSLRHPNHYFVDLRQNHTNVICSQKAPVYSLMSALCFVNIIN